MKRKIPLIGAYLIALLIACVCTIGMCTSCDHFKNRGDLNPSVVDSLNVSKLIYEYNNPEFESVTDVIDYKKGQEETHTLDSFMTATSENTLIAISSVLFKQGGRVTIRQLYREYLCNKRIYDNLPPVDINTKDSTVMEEPPTRVKACESEEKAPTTIDTIINGQKVTIIKQ